MFSCLASINMCDCGILAGVLETEEGWGALLCAWRCRTLRRT